MTSEKLNAMSNASRREAFARCCGAQAWVDAMLLHAQFQNDEDLFRKSEEGFSRLTEKDWLEAFSHHPRIGDRKNLEEKFASTASWAGNEQSGTANASEDVLDDLLKFNNEYYDKFGFIFIVCATGKSAEEMRDLIVKRLPNSRAEELANAATEQKKITKLRLEKL